MAPRDDGPGDGVGGWLSLASLARQPRWPRAQIEALPGRCRGRVLEGWARTCRRHFGEAGLRRLRQAAGPLARGIPEQPSPRAWFSAGVQVALTDALIDELLGGDALALEDLLRVEIERSMGRVQRALVRSVGPASILRRAAAIHRQAYDHGQASSVVHDREAVVTSQGSALFENPTWQLLQLIAHRLLIEQTGRVLVDIGGCTSVQRFDVRMSWR